MERGRVIGDNYSYDRQELLTPITVRPPDGGHGALADRVDGERPGG